VFDEVEHRNHVEAIFSAGWKPGTLNISFIDPIRTDDASARCCPHGGEFDGIGLEPSRFCQLNEMTNTGAAVQQASTWRGVIYPVQRVRENNLLQAFDCCF
jgi:hypothetical protein